jgi:hypothetical protein
MAASIALGSGGKSWDSGHGRRRQSGFGLQFFILTRFPGANQYRLRSNNALAFAAHALAGLGEDWEWDH